MGVGGLKGKRIINFVLLKRGGLLEKGGYRGFVKQYMMACVVGIERGRGFGRKGKGRGPGGSLSPPPPSLFVPK